MAIGQRIAPDGQRTLLTAPPCTRIGKHAWRVGNTLLQINDQIGCRFRDVLGDLGQESQKRPVRLVRTPDDGHALPLRCDLADMFLRALVVGNPRF